VQALGHWLFAETGGQPFFILETLRALVDRGVLTRQRRTDGDWVLDVTVLAGDCTDLRGFLAPGVRTAIRTRLDQLTLAAVALLQGGAVLGHGFHFDVLCQVAALDESAGLAALDGVLAGGLLRETLSAAGPTLEPRYFFSHDRIRDIVYQELSAARRQALHRRALAALEVRATPAADKAHHARSAGLYQAAVTYEIAAGDAALDLFAVGDAITHYEHAQGLLPIAFPRSGLQHPGRTPNADARRHHLYVQLGRAYELSGDADGARAIYQELLDLARHAAMPAMECDALNRLATLAAQAPADLATATTLLERALQVAETSGKTVALAETVWNLAQLSIYTWKLGQALAHGTRALALAQELDRADLVARCLNVIAAAEVPAGHFAAADGHAQEAAVRYAQLGNRAMEADCLCLAAHARLKLGRPRQAMETARAAHAISCDIHNHWGQMNSAHFLTLALLDLDRRDEALEVAQAGAALAGATGAPLMRVLAYVALGVAQRAVHALDASRATHRDAMAIVDEMGASPFLTDRVAAELCADCAVAGDWPAAGEYAQQALAARDGTFLAGGLTRWYETEALLRGGRVEDAQADVARFGELIPEHGRHRIAYLRCQAVLAQWDGAPDQAAGYLRAARALAAEMEVAGEIGPLDAALARTGADAGHRG
jgi:tetratricopeptide (TPR) repeat protein